MKFRNYILLAISMVIILGFVSAVSAGPTESITPSQTIKSGIDLTDINGTLILNNGTYDKLQDTNLSIDKSITIKGQDNVSIDAKNQNRHFLINGNNISVKFENLIFKNGLVNDENGGSILVTGTNINITFINCTFINNVANPIANIYVYGGAISSIVASYSDTSRYSNQLFINDCEFINNVATIGGGVNWYGGYYIYDTKFINGTGKATTNQGEGGGIHVRSCPQYDNIIKNCLFDGNKLTGNNQYGAAICDVYVNSANMKIIDCVFVNNDGRTIISLENGNKNLTGNYFEKNNATSVLRIGTTTANNADNVIIDSNIFIDNTFKGTFGQNQGLISLEGISSAKVYNNTLIGFPWAIYQGLGNVNVDVYNNTINTSSGIFVNAVSAGYNIYNNNIFTKDYGVYISGINNIENLTVNYNRFISESGGYAIAINRNSYTGGNYDYNWYGSNIPNVNNLVNLNNWVIVDVVPITSLNGKIVNFSYTILLTDSNVPFNVNKLPNFNGEGVASLGDSIVFNAKLNKTLTLVNAIDGEGIYTFTIDNQIFAFTGNVTIPEDDDIIAEDDDISVLYKNATNIDEDNDTVQYKNPVNDDTNRTSNYNPEPRYDSVEESDDIIQNIPKASASMKNTGLPILVLIFLLLYGISIRSFKK